MRSASLNLARVCTALKGARWRCQGLDRSCREAEQKHERGYRTPPNRCRSLLAAQKPCCITRRCSRMNPPSWRRADGSSPGDIKDSDLPPSTSCSSRKAFTSRFCALASYDDLQTPEAILGAYIHSAQGRNACPEHARVASCSPGNCSRSCRDAGHGRRTSFGSCAT
jgi:hypothetical protein